MHHLHESVDIESLAARHTPAAPPESPLHEKLRSRELRNSAEARNFADFIHNLQRERGTTCCWVARASGNAEGADVQAPLHDVHEVRIATDACNGLDGTIKEWLEQIRILADELVAGRPTAEATADMFYTVFRHYTELIKEVINQSVGTQDGSEESNVFVALTRLKEAMGIERAFLCAALTLPREALAHLPSRAFADLVIGLQEQRTYKAAIREAAPPMLLELIRAGFEYSFELRKLQAQLYDDFDVAALRDWLSPEQVWAMMTEHINKLGMVQELVLSEHEKQRCESQSVPRLAVRELLEALHAPSMNIVDLRSAYQRACSQPAETLKKELLKFLAERVAIAREANHESNMANNSKVADAFSLEPATGQSPSATTYPPVVQAADSLETLCEAVPREMRVELNELTFQRRIGQGRSGLTYRASYRGSIIAVKMANGKHGIDDWQREVLAFAKLRHVNVVCCLGIVIAPPSYGMLIEYCDGGDLASALELPTPAGFLMRVGVAIAAGMTHLHQMGILHRDLKGSNVLLDHAGTAKLTDFGCSAAVPDDTQGGGWLTAETGTYRWMAPEVICHERYSKGADVFSFGCVLGCELLCHELPFADRPALQAAVAVGLNDHRPPLPEHTPPLLRELIESCWQRTSIYRPSFAELQVQLGGLAHKLSAEELAWLDEPTGHPTCFSAQQVLEPAPAPSPLALRAPFPFAPPAPSAPPALAMAPPQTFRRSASTGDLESPKAELASAQARSKGRQGGATYLPCNRSLVERY